MSAVRVVKPGKLPEKSQSYYSGTCVNCGCEIEVPSDRMSRSFIGGYDYGCVFTDIKCPTPGCDFCITADPATHHTKREEVPS